MKLRPLLYALIVAFALWLDPLWLPLVPVALFMPPGLLGPADPFPCHVCDSDNFHGDFHVTFTGTWTGIPSGGLYGDRLDSITTACAALSSTTYVLTATDAAGEVCDPPSINGDCANRWVYQGSFDFGADCTAHNISLQITLISLTVAGSTTYELDFFICWCDLDEIGNKGTRAVADDTALSPYKDVSGKLSCGSISGLSLSLTDANSSRDCCWCATTLAGQTVSVNITAA